MDRDEEQSPIATPEGLRRFLSLHDEAVEAVVGRFDQTSPASSGPSGSAAARRAGKILVLPTKS